MLPLFNALHFVVIYVNDLVGQLKLLNAEADLSRTQKLWLSFVLSAIIISNAICWSVFERMSNGKHKSTKLLGMFRRGVICWDKLMIASIKLIIKRYNLEEGVFLLDDSNKSRSKNVKKLHAAHKVKDKATGGYSIAQNVMFLVLVTDKVTIPLGFAFYEPDADWVAWRKEDRKLKKAGVARKDRPKEPEKKTET